MKTHPVPQLILVILLILAFALPAAAQGPTPDGPATQPPRIDAAPLIPGRDPAKSPRRPLVHAGGQPIRPCCRDSAAGQRWAGRFRIHMDRHGAARLDRCQRRNRHRHQQQHRPRGPIDIGFPFKFYENVRSQVYVSRSGFLAFSDNGLEKDQSPIPDPSSPNEVIAPYWVPVDTWGPEPAVDYVRYLRGGSAPNRWFAVEWNHLRGHCCNGDGTDEYTFETILHESGNIVFQYETMTERGSAWCASSGIEDTTGLDGLEITPSCSRVAPNHAVRVTRPAPAARGAVSEDTGCFRRCRGRGAVRSNGAQYRRVRRGHLRSHGELRLADDLVPGGRQHAAGRHRQRRHAGHRPDRPGRFHDHRGEDRTPGRRGRGRQQHRPTRPRPHPKARPS